MEKRLLSAPYNAAHIIKRSGHVTCADKKGQPIRILIHLISRDLMPRIFSHKKHCRKQKAAFSSKKVHCLRLLQRENGHCFTLEDRSEEKRKIKRVWSCVCLIFCSSFEMWSREVPVLTRTTFPAAIRISAVEYWVGILLAQITVCNVQWGPKEKSPVHTSIPLIWPYLLPQS